MANKAESAYAKEEILDRYLNRADYGRGAVGLVAAAQTYFQKPATSLTLAEAALLAVRLHPGRPEPRAGWDEVLGTMVERGWLTTADRDGLTYPG
ncbi:transglycosylase domain-containing protein [Actinoplanes flavus]|uniref:Transglycosylase domain-containing protein n=1 Tax=Actinoplanes flavus TaxID=2820290 RepID=A0ABS3UIJ3_9ACTN|nr:transglycosylase domain-containing protein [Actinoplanes flavus]MBO3738598.1 transglycosylase domain-containing protein [Actinoplanes flavus]